MSAQETGFGAVDAPRPLVPPGLYDVAFDGYQTWRMFGRAPKLTLSFRIVSMGEHFEKPLQRHYNVRKLIGRPGANGSFKCGFSGEFLREFAHLFGAPSRLDRIPMSRFGHHILVARVGTVTTGAGQQHIPSGLQYSTIAQLVCVKD